MNSERSGRVASFAIAIVLLSLAYLALSRVQENHSPSPFESKPGQIQGQSILHIPPKQTSSLGDTPSTSTNRTPRQAIAHFLIRRNSRMVELWDGLKVGRLRAFKELINDTDLATLSATLTKDPKAVAELVDLALTSQSDIQRLAITMLALRASKDAEAARYFLDAKLPEDSEDTGDVRSLLLWGMSRTGSEEGLRAVTVSIAGAYDKSEPNRIYEYILAISGEAGMNRLVTLSKEMLSRGLISPATLQREPALLEFCNDPNLSPQLRKIMQSDSQLELRAMAAAALLTSERREDVEFVVDKTAGETDPSFRQILFTPVIHLSVFGDLNEYPQETKAALSDLLGKDSSLAPLVSLRMFTFLNSDSSLAELRSRLFGTDKNPEFDALVKSNVPNWLASIRTPDAARLLQDYAASFLLRNDKNTVRALTRLEVIDDPRVVSNLFDFLESAAHSGNHSKLSLAVEALGRVKTDDHNPVLQRMERLYASTRWPDTQVAILDGLERFGPKGRASLREVAVSSTDAVLRLAALSNLCRDSTISADSEVREAAKRVLRLSSSSETESHFQERSGFLAKRYLQVFEGVFLSETCSADDIPLLERLSKEGRIPIVEGVADWYHKRLREQARLAIELYSLRNDGH